MKTLRFLLPLGLLVSGCAAKYLKMEESGSSKADQEFERMVQIRSEEEAPPPPAPVKPQRPSRPAQESRSKIDPPPELEEKPAAPLRRAAPPPKPRPTKKAATPEARQPDLEDSVGFQGRRPAVDPFWVGEKVVMDVHYFKVSAGALTLEVEPFAQVNGKKAYNFVTSIKSYDNFSRFVYAVDDKAVTLMDFEEMIPRVFTLHVKESGQAKEARSFFDFDKLKATYWEKKVTKKNGTEEKKLDWEILPYSQNVFSAAFYMRLFAWETGKEYAFRVADDGKNSVFTGKALRREVLQTKLGPRKAIVIKPQITTKGVFQPMGDIYFWLSDDDRKHILRIESKIKIGTLVAEIVSLEPGRPPQ